MAYPGDSGPGPKRRRRRATAKGLSQFRAATPVGRGSVRQEQPEPKYKVIESRKRIRRKRRRTTGQASAFGLSQMGRGAKTEMQQMADRAWQASGQKEAGFAERYSRAYKAHKRRTGRAPYGGRQ